MELETNGKKYQIIYADPPWKYRNYNYNSAPRGQEKEYLTLTLNEIKSLPIEKITDNNCILFLWATFPYLKECLDVIEAWKFMYYSIGFVWVKQNKIKESLFWGMGNFTRSNAELCLIGKKGNIKPISHSVHSIVLSKIEKHSKKPNEVKDRIVKLMGDIPRIELFARERFEGWDAWGNEL